MTQEDPTIGYALVYYRIPVRQSDLRTWPVSTVSEHDPEDDAWIYDVEQAVADRLPNLLDRAAPPDVEFT